MLVREVQKLQLTARVCPLMAPPSLPPRRPIHPCGIRRNPSSGAVVCFVGREGRQEQIKIAEGGQKVEEGASEVKDTPEFSPLRVTDRSHNGLRLFSMQEFKEKEMEVKWMSSSLIV